MAAIYRVVASFHSQSRVVFQLSLTVLVHYRQSTTFLKESGTPCFWPQAILFFFFLGLLPSLAQEFHNDCRKKFSNHLKKFLKHIRFLAYPCSLATTNGPLIY